jgi:hypothetical protein
MVARVFPPVYQTAKGKNGSLSIIINFSYIVVSASSGYCGIMIE